MPKSQQSGWSSLILIYSAITIATAPAQTTYTETILHNFAGNPPKGGNPYAGVVADAAGNLYGTTSSGGLSNAGVVFKLDTTGHLNVLHAFTGGSDGGYPTAGVILDAAGNLYGTTVNGGATGAGVVYKVDTAGRQTVLHSLVGNPNAGVIRDAAGNLYGTTVSGGTAHVGSVYMLDTTGHVTVLYSFTGKADGNSPFSGVIRDAAGNLYGTTAYGGKTGAGVVYKLDASSHQTVLYSFMGGADGNQPVAGVTRDTAGNLYGATYYGGAANYGVVYKVDTAGHQSVLYSFTGGADGGNPNAGVTLDAAGNLYGTTAAGGNASGLLGSGVLFKLDTTGHQTVLYTFMGGQDGSMPQAGVILDSAGNLYGTTWMGGAGSGWGTMYKVDTSGHETVLYSFPGAVDGGCPLAGVTVDSAGSLYGTTSTGGPWNRGVVYKLDAGETILYSFTGGADGGLPYAGLIRDTAGNLYGTTSGGGLANCPLGCGVVFSLDTAGHESVLYSFTGGSDGANPEAGVTRDSAGNLYGSAYWGASGGGVVYKLDASGNETVLFSGGNPEARVARDSAGNLYAAVSGAFGSTGAIQKVDPAAGVTVLYGFTGGADGSNPTAGVILDPAGNLYGTTQFGGFAPGNAGYGVVYQVSPAGQETVLYTFTGGADGANPYAGVIRDPAGNLYGTTQYASVSSGTSYGVVYKVDTTGTETVLHTFTGGTDGGNPMAGLIRDSAGNLYGTTCAGGQGNSGVVFKLTPQ